MTGGEGSPALRLAVQKGHIKPPVVLIHHADIDHVVWPRSLSNIVMKEFRQYLSDSLLKTIRERVSLKAATKNLYSLVDLFESNKLEDEQEDHVKVLWLISFTMQCGLKFNDTLLEALMNATALAAFREVTLASPNYRSREYHRLLHLICEIFPDSKLKRERIRNVRDRNLSTLKNVTKLLAQSKRSAALSIIQKCEKKSPLHRLAFILEKEALELEEVYSHYNGDAISHQARPNMIAESDRHIRKKFLEQVPSGFQEDSYENDEDILETPRRNAKARPSHNKVLIHDDEPTGMENGESDVDESSEYTREVHIRPRNLRSRAQPTGQGLAKTTSDINEEHIGHVRYGLRPAKRQRDEGEHIDYDCMQSDEFLSDSVREKSQDFSGTNLKGREHGRPRRRKTAKRDRGDNGILAKGESSPHQGSSFSRQHEQGENDSYCETLSDQLANTDFKGSEKCVQTLHDASVTLSRSGPQDPLEKALKAARGARSSGIPGFRRNSGPLCPPREASPIPESNESPVMKRKKQHTRSLPITPTKPHRKGLTNHKGQSLRRGRFSLEEDNMLIAGLRKHGWGAWVEIVADIYGDCDVVRSAISLKDRARTLRLDLHKYPIQRNARGRPRVIAVENADHHQDNDEIEESDGGSNPVDADQSQT